MAKNQPARELTYEEELEKELAEAREAEVAREAQIAAEAAERDALKKAAETVAVPAAATQDPLMMALLTTLANQGQAIQKLLERNEQHTGPTPQVPFAKFKQKTPWNPTGAKYKPLTRPTFLNGHRLKEKTLSQEEIDLLNQVKPGIYNGRKWTVIEQSTNENGAGAIKIYFPNKTPEQRMALMEDGRTLVELLQKLLREQNAVVLAA